MKISSLLPVCVLTLCLVHSAQANTGNISAGIKAGTLGIGGELGLTLTDSLVLRGGANYLNFSFDSSVSNVDYEMEPEFKNLSLILDWHPFENGFRLSGGVFLNDSKIKLNGSPEQDLLLPYASYASYISQAEELVGDVKVHGKAEMNNVAPYVGIGWNSNAPNEEGWGISCELGVLFMGSPSVSDLSLSGSSTVEQLNNNAVVQQTLDDERKALEDDLEDFQYYPVGSVMVHYTF